MNPGGRGVTVGDVRLILWRLEASSKAEEFDVGGCRPGGMISRVTEGEGGEAANDLVILSASGREGGPIRVAVSSSVGDVRLILWRLEAPSTAAEFGVVGWRLTK